MVLDPRDVQKWKALILDADKVLADPEAGPLWQSARLEPLLRLAQRRRIDVAGALRSLLAEREGVIALLGDIEWSRERAVDLHTLRMACPACDGLKPGPGAVDAVRHHGWRGTVGHADDCRLAALLRE